MLRVFFFALVPLLLPAFCYAAWRVYKHVKAHGFGQEVDWSDTPWHWLLAIGLGLLIVTLVVVSMQGNGRPGDTYVPPRVVDGVIVPGHTIPKEQ